MQEASHGISRTFPPTAPVSKFYRTAPMPRSPTPHNLISLHAGAQASVDPRNVFSLRPA